MINDFIKEGIKFVNYEKIREGIMTINNIKLAKTSHNNDIVLFEGEAVNSKGLAQVNNITKRFEFDNNDSIKFAVGYVVKLLHFLGVPEVAYINAQTFDEFIKIAAVQVKGKQVKFKTTITKVGQVKIEEKEFDFTK